MAQNSVEKANSTEKLQKIFDDISHLAEQNPDDTLFLLSLLRNLEAIHRQIRSNLFEASLPQTRNDLYSLVKDVEEQGGWPYIERMRLQKLMERLKSDIE